MNGKYVLINFLVNLGFFYFNYKGLFSIVLLVLVDVNYKFLYVDIGCNVKILDGDVFKNFFFYRVLEDNSFYILGLVFFLGLDEVIFYVIVVDDVFLLKIYI